MLFPFVKVHNIKLLGCASQVKFLFDCDVAFVSQVLSVTITMLENHRFGTVSDFFVTIRLFSVQGEPFWNEKL